MSSMGRFATLLPRRSLTRSLFRSPLFNFATSPAISAFVSSSSLHLPATSIQARDSSPTICPIMTSFPASHPRAWNSMHTQIIHGVVRTTNSSSNEQTGVRRRNSPLTSQIDCRLFPAEVSMAYSNLLARNKRFEIRDPWFSRASGNHRGFASSVRDVSGGPSAPGGTPSLPPAATPSGTEGSASRDPADVAGNVVESAQKAGNSLVEMVTGAWEASKEAATEMFPSVHNWMDPSGGGVAELVVPACTAIGVSLAAWLVLPKVLRKVHYYVESGPTARLLGRLPQEKQPYELSVFCALEDPARWLATVVTFSYLGYIVAPSSIAGHYLTQIWSGATVLSVIWFLHRWKSNVFARMLTGKTVTGTDRERYLTMDRVSSIGLLLLGGMALAEACGVAVQSILTVGGIGGVATAFAARDILGNMLSGVALQFSRPFSVGDSISAGSVTGQVIEMGLHSTQLLNSDKFPIVVPNSFFSNQVIVNKSRVRWRGLSLNLPVQIQDLEKIPGVTHEIRTMLTLHPKVYLEKEKPRCHVSQVGSSSLNIAITCNVKPMGTDEYLVTQEEVLMEAAHIVIKTGATLGATV